MIYKEHYIEILVNGKKLDIESQKSLNLRFNSVLYDAEEIASSQGEYSFSFELPSTPNNDKIFDYANNLAKLNKFHQRYNAEVYADGLPIFTGTLTLNSCKGKKYGCNLVSIKVYSLDEIFGDATMNEIPWYIDFSGSTTVDDYNSRLEAEVVFPLVCYGAYQKSPYSTDSVARDYTSKFDLDKWNRWYIESFYPSANMLETVRKAFEYKGYAVDGDAFEDFFLKDIYCSVNLADGQTPEYNIGMPKFGSVELQTTFMNPNDTLATSYGTTQSLKYPYFKSGNDYYDLRNQEPISVSPEFNFTDIKMYDMLSSNEGGNVSVSGDTYMYQPDEHIIVIPADGFYKIDLEVSSELVTTNQLTAQQYVHSWDENTSAMTLSVERKSVTFTPDYRITTPLEIQLVRNYDGNAELIKGKNNIWIGDGYPDNDTQMNKGIKSNYYNWITCYPHEKLGKFSMGNPTTSDDMPSRPYSDADIGYVPSDGEIMAYDPLVSDAFICGFSSMGNKDGGGTPSVIKNGYSWSNSVSSQNAAFYPEVGYYKLDYTSNFNIASAYTNYNYNTYINCPSTYFYQNGNTMNGRLSCMVELKKNDVLQLFAIHRDYTDENGYSVTYQTSATTRLKITAASPRSYAELKDGNYTYHSQTEFPTKLKISNFFNEETKISDWISNVVKAFNLEVIQNGKNVTINSKKKFDSGLLTAVDIDDRVNSAEAVSSMIDYPKSMSVRYKIDTDEWGFERSVTPREKLNDADWKNYGDSGFTVIYLNDDTYQTSESNVDINFSYTYYDAFNWYAVDSGFNQTSSVPVTLRLPVISKYSYMIDGYDYEESMKKDGYGQPQRFWFKPNATGCYVFLRSYPAERVMIYEPTNLWTNYKDTFLNLSYKSNENSLLTQYFNYTPYLASNYVTVEAYITPEEYRMIKNGALVHFDSDLYMPIQVDGFDPTGNNKTEIKMIKKV